jgi:hypothetical protein
MVSTPRGQRWVRHGRRAAGTLAGRWIAGVLLAMWLGLGGMPPGSGSPVRSTTARRRGASPAWTRRIHHHRPQRPPLPAQPPFNPGAGSGAASTGRNPSTMSTQGGPRGNGHTFEAPIESMHHVRTNWEPVNDQGDVAIQEARLMLRHVPDFLEGAASMLEGIGQTANERIGHDTGSAEVMGSLHRLFSGPMAAIRDTIDAYDRPHLDDIATMQGGDPRAAALDYDRNAGYPQM